MKNVLKRFEENGTEFFVMKSFVYAAFDTDMKRANYHIYYIKKNSNPDAYHRGYMNLKIRKMNKMEITHFKENKEKLYEVSLRNEDGTVYNMNERAFDTLQCPCYKQFSLNL